MNLIIISSICEIGALIVSILGLIGIGVTLKTINQISISVNSQKIEGDVHAEKTIIKDSTIIYQQIAKGKG